MKCTLVSISLTPEGMGTIKATPELQKAEMQFINDWNTIPLLVVLRPNMCILDSPAGLID